MATMMRHLFLRQHTLFSPRRHSIVISSRLLSSSLTPGEAGKRAQELAQQQQQQQKQHASTTMDTVLAHAGVSDKKSYHNTALTPPLEFATTFTRPAEGPYQEGDAIYSRLDNPTRLLLEETVFQLETQGSATALPDNMPDVGTSMTCAFASGMMAASSIVLAHKTPLMVILPHDLYHGVSTVMNDVFQERMDIQVERVDLRHVANLEDELVQLEEHTTNSVIVWMETPSNPQCHVLDIQAICQAVDHFRQRHPTMNITTVVDSTLAPPVIQQPLQQGVDVVMHSGTKGLAGHSDALIGITTANPWTPQGRTMGPLLKQVQQAVGGVASPMDSWLTLRGLRTLQVRVERQCQTAMALASWLDQNALIKQVHYPGLASHPNHDVAQRQMKPGHFGGVLSIEFHSEHMAYAFAGALQTIYRATSLGGTETLIEERRSIEPPARQTSPPGLLRLSVGLENVNDLKRDMEQALEIAQQVVVQ